jgi:hypothetical protein
MLNYLPAAIIASQETTTSLSHSALPNAPVIAEPVDARPRTYRTRAALSTGLARIADAVAPKGWAPSHQTASSR